MYIIRERYLSKIRNFYEVDLIKVLTGVRRCGKSVLLSQIEAEIAAGGVDDGHMIRVNFEDIAYEKIRSAEKLNDYILEKITDDKKYYIFLDEIQHVRQFEKVLASLRATQNCSIFITGSNSKLLSGKMATLLVGRCVEFRIMPFSFGEAYEFVSQDQTISPDEFIFDYLRWGGFPQRFAFHEERDITLYLQQTYQGIVDRDIITDPKRTNREKLLKIASYVMANAGKEFSAQSVSKFFVAKNDDPIDKASIYRYLDRMEKACLINRVKRFDIIGKRQLAYIEKQYAVDTGFRMINTNFNQYENTFFLENIIYNELYSRGYQIFVGKTQRGEIDFLVLDGRKKCFIQVAYYLQSEEVVRREFDAFKDITDASPKYVLSLDRMDFSHDGIIHMNILDFLFEKSPLLLT
ncbi:MAG: ATP-binding protein [Peptococcaceae bacterium]|nr:ATP-binding protein [Peptococcaceae bacterium]